MVGTCDLIQKTLLKKIKKGYLINKPISDNDLKILMNLKYIFEGW